MGIMTTKAMDDLRAANDAYQPLLRDYMDLLRGSKKGDLQAAHKRMSAAKDEIAGKVWVLCEVERIERHEV